MRHLTVLFRYTCLAAVLAAALLVFFDFYWQQRAWEAAFKSSGRTYSKDLIQAGSIYSALWLIAGLIQIITIKRAVFGMNVCRAIALIAASYSILSSGPEMWQWYTHAKGSLGEPLPRSLVWGDADIVLSGPVALLSVLVFLLFGISQKMTLLPEGET